MSLTNKGAKKKSYQEWCIDTINVILQMENQDESQYGYKMIVKDIIRHYPEVFLVDGEQIHFWTKAISQGIVGSFRESFIASFIMTEKAHDVAVNGSVEEIRKNLYQEHITPVQYVFESLDNLRKEKKETIENIRKCMVQNKLVLLHGEEKKFLDGKRFNSDDLACLERVVSEVQHMPVDVKAELEDARKLTDKSSTDHGSGLLRLCKLLVSGIKFVDANDEACSNEQLVRCLVSDFTEYTTTIP